MATCKYCNKQFGGDQHDCVAEVARQRDEWEREYEKLLAAIREHHDQRVDDRCWMDDSKLYEAAGIPHNEANRYVGDKFEMVQNCLRFLETRCRDGVWKTYKELEEQNAKLKLQLAELQKPAEKSRAE